MLGFQDMVSWFHFQTAKYDSNNAIPLNQTFDLQDLFLVDYHGQCMVHRTASTINLVVSLWEKLLGPLHTTIVTLSNSQDSKIVPNPL